MPLYAFAHGAALWSFRKIYHSIGSMPALRMVIAMLLVAISATTAQAQTDAQCYDPANAQTVGQAGWVGCEGMYIVRDKAELVAAVNAGAPYQITSDGTDYTFADSANNIFTGQVTDMSRLFSGRTSFNDNIGYWDTSNVLYMNEMFYQASAFNQPIGDWDTSRVFLMQFMFYQATAFNQPIGGWETTNAINMEYMFHTANAFNQPIGGWDTSSVSTMRQMFLRAASFNQPIGGWNTSGVTDMSAMFYEASAFDQPIGGWDTSSVSTMRLMFYRASMFNQPIDGWDTSGVADMSFMFFEASAFDQPIGSWDTSNVTTMEGLFYYAIAFNQPIGGWDTSSVRNMRTMLFFAGAFDQDLSTWNVASIASQPSNFDTSTLASWTTAEKPQWGTSGIPQVQSITSATANGSYGVGDTIQIDMQFDQSVTVTGTPQLTLETGAVDRVIDYTPTGSTADTLRFIYTVQTGDSTADLDYVSTSALGLNGGTVQSAAGADASLALKSPGGSGSLSATSDIVIDATGPSATAVLISSNNTNPEFAKADDTITLALTFDEALSAAPTVTLFGKTATVNGSGTNWTATAVVEAASPNGEAAISVTNYADLAGNAGDPITEDTDGNTIEIDTVAPTLTLQDTPEPLTMIDSLVVDYNFSEDVFNIAPDAVTVENAVVEDITEESGGTDFLTINVMPDGNGNVIINVAAGVAQDAAGNAATAADELVVLFDDVLPTAAISPVPATVTTTEAFDVTITFSEDVSNFSVPNLSIISASVELVEVVNPRTYIVSITPDGTGDIEFAVGLATAQDAVGNLNEESEMVFIGFDDETPSINEYEVPDIVNSRAPILFTIYFSEDVFDFEASDFEIGNGEVTSFAIIGDVPDSIYDVEVTPDGAGDITINIPAGAARDAAGNLSTEATEVVVLFDDERPTIEILNAPTTITTADPFTVTFQFSEDVSELDIGDISVEGAQAENFTQTNARTYTLEITPDDVGDITVGVSENAVEDSASNGNSEPLSVLVLFPNEPPTIEVLGAPMIVNSTDEFTVQLLFSELVTGLGADDIDVMNGNVEALIGSDGENTSTDPWRDFTARIKPDGEGDIVIGLPAEMAADSRGVGNFAATPVTIIYDASAPTVEVQGAPHTTNTTEPFEITLQFSEAVMDFAEDGIEVGNGDTSNFSEVDARTYTVQITPDGSGDVTIDVGDGAARDTAGNSNVAAAQVLVVYDAVAPTLEVQDAPDSVNATDTFMVTFQFSEDVRGFAVDDIDVVNGDAAEFTLVNDSTFTAEITPDGNGDITIDVAGGAAQDLAGNDSIEATQILVVYDAVGPVASVVSLVSDNATSGVATSGDNVTLTLAFDEALAAAPTVALFGETALVSGSGINWTAALVVEGSSQNGAATILVTGYADELGNVGTAVTDTTDGTEVVIDTGAPSLVITGPQDASRGIFTATFTFSEDVTGFEATDIDIVGGLPLTETFTGIGAVYTLDIDPEVGGTVAVSVATQAALDLAGNGNQSSNILELQSSSPATEFAANEEEIRRIIRDDTRRRLQNDISFNQSLVRSARQRFRDSRTQIADGQSGLVGRNNVPFDVNGTINIVGRSAGTQGSFLGQAGSDDGRWRRIFFGDFNIQQDEDGSRTYSLNSDLAWEQMISSQTMLGYYVGAQVGGSEFEGTFEGTRSSYGVMAGVYAVSSLSKNLIADSFLSASVSRSELAVSNGILDLESEYDSTAAIAGASLSGIVPVGPVELQPELSAVFGKAFMGDVGFVGRAFGIEDSDLSLDAENVMFANVMFRPVARVPFGQSGAQIVFAPRFECQWLDDVENCQLGADLGMDYRSEDGLTAVDIGVSADDLSNRNFSGLRLQFEHSF